LVINTKYSNDNNGQTQPISHKSYPVSEKSSGPIFEQAFSMDTLDMSSCSIEKQKHIY